jgi:hypothetical protein
MAGTPLKRARKQGVRLDDGTVIPFPYMPRVADLPPGWRRFSTADKIKHLLRMNLDQVDDILSWPITEVRCMVRASEPVAGRS